MEFGNYEMDYTLVDDKKPYEITYYTGIVNDPDLITTLKSAKTSEGKAIEISASVPDNTFGMAGKHFKLCYSAGTDLDSFWIPDAPDGRRSHGVGKSTAKVYVEKTTGVTFKDVAGQDEAKESLQEVVDFLHNPKKYSDIGAKLPKGALLVGPPGTGKTLLAKAVAGEAKVPFFLPWQVLISWRCLSVWALPVCVICSSRHRRWLRVLFFIDEIDAIGKSRDSQYGGGNDEREQTLNQLLSEMDGFDASKGILILAATNRPEVLDQALLRPGRFDRRIIVDKPDLKGRLRH